MQWTFKVQLRSKLHQPRPSRGLNKAILVPPTTEMQKSFSQDVSEELKQAAQNVVNNV